ncbi:MAG: hypothetical protein QNJ98_09550 [Planctomycetota bacterium]|nr:hypothetical protein [Planctomycetota bacterium]
MEVAAVLHSIPGRIRVRVPSLRNNDEAAALLEARLSVLPSVSRVESNVATGTLVLHHDPDAHEAMEAALEDLLPSLESTAAASGGNGAVGPPPAAEPARPKNEAVAAAAAAADREPPAPDDEAGWAPVMAWLAELTSDPSRLKRMVPLTFGALGAVDLLRRLVLRRGLPMPNWYTLLWYSYATWGLMSQAGAAGGSEPGEVVGDDAPDAGVVEPE